jgi:flagellar protein FlbD
MIMLTRLSGKQFVLNSDLIERVDATPDTVVTLTNGTKYVVSESMREVVDAARLFRSEIVALSGSVTPAADPGTSSPRLTPVAQLISGDATAGLERQDL